MLAWPSIGFAETTLGVADDYSRYFDDGTRATVAAYFAADIRAFSFRFETAGMGKRG
jgi:hypothetical protein